MRFNPQPKTFTPPKEKTRMKTVRTDDTGKLRRKLDDVFSKYIRKKYPKCFTCNHKGDQCSHFMRRNNDATRWDEDNCRNACWECNVLKEGNLTEFRKRLVEEIGEYRVSEVERKARLDVKFSASDLLEMIDNYSKK